MSETLITRVSGFQADDAVKIHRERSRIHDYVTLGRVVWINLAVDVGDRELTPQDRLLLGKIDYFNDGPLIARSLDYHDVLLPFGAKKFPDAPDPLWVPPAGSVNPKPPMIRQSMTDRAYAETENADGTWVIFQPVLEVWVRRFDEANYGVIRFHPFLDTQASLIINRGNRESFFLGGRPEFMRFGRLLCP